MSLPNKQQERYPPSPGSCNAAEDVPITTPTFVQQVSHDFKRIFSKDGRNLNGRDWRLIFAQSYFYNCISPHALLAWRLIVFFWFIGSFVDDMNRVITAKLDSYLVYLTNLVFLLNLVNVTWILLLNVLALSEWSYSQPLQVDEVEAFFLRSSLGNTANKVSNERKSTSHLRLPGYKDLFLAQPNQISARQILRPSRVTDGFIKSAWAVNSVSLTYTVVVALLFWGVLIPFTRRIPNTYDQIFKHLINVPLLFISLILSNIPYPLFHGVYIVFFAILYSILNLLIFAFAITINKTQVGYVYNILNFNANPTFATILLVGNIFIFTPLVTVVLYLIVGWKRCRLVNPARVCCPAAGSELRDVQNA